MNDCATSETGDTSGAQPEEGGSTPTVALHFSECKKEVAVEFVRQHHSRLPACQRGPWKYAFSASIGGKIVATALWNNPSARTLPGCWIELRRMACSSMAPKNTASAFLAWMVRWIKKNHPEHPEAISYQDTSVHTGTIYKAAGWEPKWITRARVRDRSKPRRGQSRAYRSDCNGPSAASSEKIRWHKQLQEGQCSQQSPVSP